MQYTNATDGRRTDRRTNNFAGRAVHSVAWQKLQNVQNQHAPECHVVIGKIPFEIPPRTEISVGTKLALEY